MNKKIESLYTEIAQTVYSFRSEQSWDKGIYVFKGINLFIEEQGFFESIEKNDRKYFVAERNLTHFFIDLRSEMAKLNPEKGAWYTATFTLTPDGNFKFDFDYDHLPAFDIIPSPDKWADEFKHYPRPELQAHVQDWMDKKAEHSVIVARLRELQLK